jgi:hypothetical protein
MIRQPYKDVPNDKPNTLFPDRLRWEPLLPVRLGYKHARSPRLFAYVDSGSPYCLFKADLATLVGLDPIKNPLFIDNLSGVVDGPKDLAYFHKVIVYLEAGHRIEVIAGFSKKLNTAGILGRSGFFEQFKVTFDHSTDPPGLEIEKLPKVN